MGLFLQRLAFSIAHMVIKVNCFVAECGIIYVI
jgi:hypothetical protein